MYQYSEISIGKLLKNVLYTSVATAVRSKKRVESLSSSKRHWLEPNSDRNPIKQAENVHPESKSTPETTDVYIL